MLAAYTGFSLITEPDGMGVVNLLLVHVITLIPRMTCN